MEELSVSNKKRVRDDSAEPEVDLPEVKRLKDDLLSDFLDDSDPHEAVLDLDSVMKSFEVEISSSASLPLDVVDLTSLDSGESRTDLGYLLEASDDELGLPPSSTVSMKEVKNDDVTELVRASSGASGISELLGFEDNINIPSYDSFESGFGGGDHLINDYVAFDDGLFEYSNVYYDSAEISDFSWRYDTLPAE